MNISCPKNVSLPCKGTVIAVEIAHGCFSVVARQIVSCSVPVRSEWYSVLRLVHK